MEPSMVGVAHCAHAGAEITRASMTTKAMFNRRARRMEILASSLALATPVVFGKRPALRRRKAVGTLVSNLRALIGPDNVIKCTPNCPLRGANSVAVLLNRALRRNRRENARLEYPKFHPPQTGNFHPGSR